MESCSGATDILFKTGLFESPLEEDYQLKLIDSNYSLFLDFGSALWWERYQGRDGAPDYRMVPLEVVLSGSSPSVQEVLLFHLDLLSGDLVSSLR
jgi:hypothetical protein